MIVHTIFAIISDGIIKNVSVGDYEITNYIAKASYGPDAFAVEVTQYPVQEGDLYENGNFYRVNSETQEKTAIEMIPTDRDEINNIKNGLDVVVRPFTMLAQTFDEKTALEAKPFYKEWNTYPNGTELKEPMYILCDGELYKVIKTHNKQDNWKPGTGTETLFQRIDVTHAGTMEDPIPAALNMIYYKGKIYIENDVLYRCTRDSEIALQHMPSQLIGHYFEVVNKQ